MEKYKVVNRIIRFDSRNPTSSYKCEYKDKNSFEILQIVCTYSSERRIYEVESKYLKATSKSIYFDAERNGDSIIIEWKPKDVSLYIK